MEERKKLIIHDLPDRISSDLFSAIDDNFIVINANMKAARCVGCFRCWLKEPGFCRFADNLETVGQFLLSSEEIIIITEMLYGGMSIPVKRVIDRCIPGVTPFFKKRFGKLHHLQRYKTETSIKTIFYNTKNNTEEEKIQGKAYINAMGINFYSKYNEVLYIDAMDFSGVDL